MRAWTDSSAPAMAVAMAIAGCSGHGDAPGWPAEALAKTTGEVSFRDTARPWVIGHRGTGADDGSEPRAENTIPSFEHSILVEGAVGVELDVMLTRDLEVVVMHDPRLERTTDCSGCVSERTLAEVKACTALGGKLGGVHPPSLAEALAALEALPVEPLIMIDTKLAPMDGCPLVVAAEQHAAELGRRLGEVVERGGLARIAGVQGPPELLVAARAAAPAMMTLVARPSMDEAVTIARANDFTGVAVGLEKLDVSSLSRARTSGEIVDTFVVNAPVDLAVAVTTRVDVIETDRVEDILGSFSR
jgi:glycerophosphoryl diester phosphodiesterase